MNFIRNLLFYSVKTFSFIAIIVLRLLIFTVTISFALLKFTLGIVFLILSIGSFASHTSRY